MTKLRVMMLSCLMLALPAAAAEPSFLETLSEEWAIENTPALAYALIVDGDIEEIGAVGVADSQTGAPATVTTPFRIASLTKPLSAALALNAEEAGTLSLDMPLVEASSKFAKACWPMKVYFKLNGLPFLDGVKCGDRTIKVRHVLTHTSKHPAGSVYSYNGFMFGLLSDEIGDVTVGGGDDNFVLSMRRDIIDKLALPDSAAGISDEKAVGVIARLALPHKRSPDNQWRVQPLIADELNAGAGFIASIADMAAIDMAYRSEILSSEEVWAGMTAPVYLSGGERSPYSMGWFVQEIEGEKVVWHYGLQPEAYSALWIRLEDRNRSLILLANSADLTAGRGLSAGDIAQHPAFTAFRRWAERSAPETN